MFCNLCQACNVGAETTNSKTAVRLHVDPLRKSASAHAVSDEQSWRALSASCRPSSTAFTKGSVAALRSALARLRAASSSSRISGRMPLVRRACTNVSPDGVRIMSSGGTSFSLHARGPVMGVACGCQHSLRLK